MYEYIVVCKAGQFSILFWQTNIVTDVCHIIQELFYNDQIWKNTIGLKMFFLMCLHIRISRQAARQARMQQRWYHLKDEIDFIKELRERGVKPIADRAFVSLCFCLWNRHLW